MTAFSFMNLTICSVSYAHYEQQGRIGFSSIEDWILILPLLITHHAESDCRLEDLLREVESFHLIADA